MVEIDDDDEKLCSKPVLKNYVDQNPKGYLNHYPPSSVSSSMRRTIRPLFSALVLLVLAATISCRFAIRSGFMSIYLSNVVDEDVNDEGLTGEAKRVLDFPLFNSSLLKLSEVEIGEDIVKMQIEELLEGNLVGQSKLQYRGHFMSWFRGRDVDFRALLSKGNMVSLRSPQFSRTWPEFRKALHDWSRKKGFESDIMSELVDLVKLPIDRHKGFKSGKMYSSCAVVGNSGILLNNDHGDVIDGNEVVIRLNNARIEGYKRHVGSKTSISFINSNILHQCSRRDACPCHPYGQDVAIVMYICQPVHFLDYTICNASHKAPLIVTDPRFDVLASRLVKYYSLKRLTDRPNKTLEQWIAAHDGAMFHYSSGMQAVMLALGTCNRVSLFGFGKAPSAKHHYHTSQRVELSLHDYEAEFDFFRDLVERPEVIPFISSKFKFPPVTIHR